MKILGKEQLYQADRMTLEAGGISSEALMERAATLAFNWLHSRLQGRPVNIHIFCGIGNNGGDGLVAARKIHSTGGDVRILLLGDIKKFKGPAKKKPGDRLQTSYRNQTHQFQRIFKGQDSSI